MSMSVCVSKCYYHTVTTHFETKNVKYESCVLTSYSIFHTVHMRHWDMRKTPHTPNLQMLDFLLMVGTNFWTLMFPTILLYQVSSEIYIFFYILLNQSNSLKQVGNFGNTSWIMNHDANWRLKYTLCKVYCIWCVNIKYDLVPPNKLLPSSLHYWTVLWDYYWFRT